MPFDSTPIFDPLTFSPGREGLRKLARLLRHGMPAQFRWDFRTIGAEECGTHGCAIGLARAVWPEAREAMPGKAESWSREVADTFGMSHAKAYEIFFDPTTYRRRWGEMHLVTPADVADAIEKFLAS
jgi:hypothetical protein